MGLDTLEYTVTYSDRKTISLEVERDGHLRVRAPRTTSDKEIEQFVQKRRFWVYQKRKAVHRQAEIARKREYVSGETFPYLGRHYRLDVRDTPDGELRFENKFILPQQLLSKASDCFHAWYKARADERIGIRTRRWARLMGIEFNRVMISDMSRRWATCTAKENLNFNWRLIMAPMQVVDYVIVHELAHIIEPEHSDRFWNLVRVTVPRYRNSLNWLEKHGQELEFEL